MRLVAACTYFNRGDICSRDLYHNHAVHVTKIVWFDWLVVFESFWYKKLAPNRAVFRFVQVSGTSFLSAGHPYKYCYLLSAYKILAA